MALRIRSTPMSGGCGFCSMVALVALIGLMQHCSPHLEAQVRGRGLSARVPARLKAYSRLPVLFQIAAAAACPFFYSRLPVLFQICDAYLVPPGQNSWLRHTDTTPNYFGKYGKAY